MQLLLDTHTFLWYVTGDKRTSPEARNLITDADNGVFVSIASLWEIAIKFSIGKLTLTKPFSDLIPRQLDDNSIGVLDISLDDLALVAALPFHHRDPFDRLIIAQAMGRSLPIVGRDRKFDAYDVTMIW